MVIIYVPYVLTFSEFKGLCSLGKMQHRMLYNLNNVRTDTINMEFQMFIAQSFTEDNEKNFFNMNKCCFQLNYEQLCIYYCGSAHVYIHPFRDQIEIL